MCVKRFFLFSPTNTPNDKLDKERKMSMSKFNCATKNPKMTYNNCGVSAFNMTNKKKLVTQVLTSLFNEHKFYGNNSKK